jgi:Flp pilus assembly protein TadD
MSRTLQEVLLTVFLGATLFAVPAAARKPMDLRQIIQERGLDPAEIIQPLLITEEMRSWALALVTRSAPDETQLKILLESLRSSEELAFEYKGGYTGTAEEVFSSGKYNCLSFSMLFVGLARALGLPAYFLNVKQAEAYEKRGDLVILTRHITAGYGFVKDRTILEFDIGAEINYLLAEPMTDLEALALYYSNRGTEWLRAGQGKKANQMLEIAITLGPKIAQSWINLGVVRRRQGHMQEAEDAYIKALEVEAGNATAYENLATLLRLKGERDAASQMLELLNRRKNRNPFTYLALGDLNLEEGRVQEAESFYRRALRLARDEAETHAAMGQWALAAGKREKARSWLERARALDTHNARVFELENRLLRPSEAPSFQQE